MWSLYILDPRLITPPLPCPHHLLLFVQRLLPFLRDGLHSLPMMLYRGHVLLQRRKRKRLSLGFSKSVKRRVCYTTLSTAVQPINSFLVKHGKHSAFPIIHSAHRSGSLPEVYAIAVVSRHLSNLIIPFARKTTTPLAGLTIFSNPYPCWFIVSLPLKMLSWIRQVSVQTFFTHLKTMPNGWGRFALVVMPCPATCWKCVMLIYTCLFTTG